MKILLPKQEYIKNSNVFLPWFYMNYQPIQVASLSSFYTTENQYSHITVKGHHLIVRTMYD